MCLASRPAIASNSELRELRSTLRKAERQLTDDLVFRLVQTHAMRDWDTPEDDEAFRDL